ncbi:MAG: hypothetical protein EZS28_047241, partial [Streblomastix strix]
MFSGFGTYYYDDGSRYEGDWVGNMRNNFGTMYYKDGEIYSGSWRDDIREGRGTLFKADGNVIQGNYENDVPHGACVYFTPAKKRKYTGEWFEGIPKCGVYEEEQGPFPSLKSVQDAALLEGQTKQYSTEADLGAGATARAKALASRITDQPEQPLPDIQILMLRDPEGVINEALRESQLDYLRRRYPESDAHAMLSAIERGDDINEVLQQASK